MVISRRDFIKMFGITVASLALTRCKQPSSSPPTPTCYTATPIAPTPEFTHLPAWLPAEERLRLCWLSFEELSQQTTAGKNNENNLGQGLIADHRASLDELVVAGELATSVADLVQEAYEAAIYHAWRSNAAMTCYVMVETYSLASAGSLLQQSEILSQISETGIINPETIAGVKSALEQDMAYYALSEQEIQSLNQQITSGGEAFPLFEELNLELAPEARAAAEFIVELLIKV